MFRGAVRADMAKILEVYARARDFMAKNGNPTQWVDNYPSPELLEEDIDTNRLFVYMINGRMQAVFAFVLGEDPTYQTIEDGQWQGRLAVPEVTPALLEDFGGAIHAGPLDCKGIRRKKRPRNSSKRRATADHSVS